MQTMQKNVSNNLNGANQTMKQTVTNVTTYPNAKPIKQSQDYHKQFVTNTEYNTQAPTKNLETVVEMPTQEIITETITTKNPVQTTYTRNINQNNNLDNQNIVEKVVTTTTTTKVNKNLNPELRNQNVIKEVKEEVVTHTTPNLVKKRYEFKRPEKNDPNLFSTERNFVKDSGIASLQPLKKEQQKPKVVETEHKKVIVLDEKKDTNGKVSEYNYNPKRVTRRIYVRDEAKNATLPREVPVEKVVVEEVDLKAQNRELMRKNEELANRLNYIGNYEQAVDRNIKINNEQGDHKLENLNERVNSLVKENNDLRERINKGENVSHDLSKMDVTIDEIEQKQLDNIKGKLIEKNLKINKLNDQLKTYTKETTTMEDYLHLKNEADRLRGEKNNLEMRRHELEERMNNQTQEINRLKQENANLRNSFGNINESKTLRNIKYAPEGLVTKRVTQRPSSTTYTRQAPQEHKTYTTYTHQAPQEHKTYTTPTTTYKTYTPAEQTQPKYTTEQQTINVTQTIPAPEQPQICTYTREIPQESVTTTRVIRKPSTTYRKPSNSPVVTHTTLPNTTYKPVVTKRSTSIHKDSVYKPVEIKRSTSRVNLNPSEYKKTGTGTYQVVSHPLIIRNEQTDVEGKRRITVNEYDAEDYSRIMLDQDVQQKKRSKGEEFLKTTETAQERMGDVVKTTTVKTTTIEQNQ